MKKQKNFISVRNETVMTAIRAESIVWNGCSIHHGQQSTLVKTHKGQRTFSEENELTNT